MSLVCVKKEGTNILRSREKAAYTLTESSDKEEYTIIYDPTFKGHKYCTHPRGQRTHDNTDHNPEYDDGILDDDLRDLADDLTDVITSASNLTDYITIDEELDSDLAVLTIQDQFPLDDDLHLLLDDDLDDLNHLIAMTAPAVSAASIRIPRNYNEAMKTPQAKDWDAATWVEFNALAEKKVYKVVLLPPGQKALPTKLLHKAKPTLTGDLAKLKVRVVVRGDLQKDGEYETFSSTARSDSIHILLAICVMLR